jgi:hypothetical protein
MAPRKDAPLFTGVGANANSSAIDWPGGRGVFSVWGTFGSGTCALQWSPDDGTTWIAADRSGDTFVTLTANGTGGFELPPGKIRAALTGSTSPSLYASVGGSNW